MTSQTNANNNDAKRLRHNMRSQPDPRPSPPDISPLGEASSEEIIVILTAQEARFVANTRRQTEDNLRLIGQHDAADIHEAVAFLLENLATNPERSLNGDQTLTAGDVETLAGLHEMLAETIRRVPWRQEGLGPNHIARAHDLRTKADAARKRKSTVEYLVSA